MKTNKADGYAVLKKYKAGSTARMKPTTLPREVRMRGCYFYIWEGDPSLPILVSQEALDAGMLSDCPFPLRWSKELSTDTANAFLRTDIKRSIT